MATDFFTRQDEAKKQTGRLLLLYVLAVVTIIVAVHLVVTGATGNRFTNPKLMVLDAGAALFIILCGTAISYASLGAGGKAVAESCGGRQINPATRDPDERRLINVVEEMSIASGVPVPAVYVLDEEEGINAFAAGLNTSNAAVAVTRGALEQFTRDELQGVIGHEFSHILNGDMELNLKLASWLAGIMGLAVVGEIMMRAMSFSRPRRSSSSDKNGGNAAMALFLIGIGLLILGYIGVFFARLIQAAVSRQREYLADASAVQFTRNPAGLSGALKKIGGFSEGSTLQNPQAKVLRHMFFSSADKPSFFEGLYATHPPIKERIKWLDPSFNPEMAKLAGTPPPVPQSRGTPAGASGIAAVPPVIGMTERVGTPRAENLQAAESFLGALPDELRTAAEDPYGASAIVFALLLSDEPAMRERQLTRLHELTVEPVWHDLEIVVPHVAGLQPGDKLPLVDLALAGLHQLSAPQFQQFSKTLDYLIASDGRMNLFEFALQKLLRRHLQVFYGEMASPRARFGRLELLAQECQVLLSALSWAGQFGDPRRAAAAFAAGAEELQIGTRLALLPIEASGLKAVNTALDRLNEAEFSLKRKILNAGAVVVAKDGVIKTDENELLRAISDTLDCPVPKL